MIMNSKFVTPEKSYVLYADKYTCNRFGLAEFFAEHYSEFSNVYEKNILDVGCGVFPLGIYLADQYHCKVIGVDINPIAVGCSTKNIRKYKLNDRCSVINSDFSKSAELLCNVEYDLLVSIPPVDNNVHFEKIEKYTDDQYASFDDDKFSYITNSWHTIDGKDLLDYIFEYANKNLRIDGRVIIVSCLMTGVSKDYVINKAHEYGLKESQVVCGRISGKSIGVETLGIMEVQTAMIAFRKERK